MENNGIQTKGTARDIFLHLLSTVMLIVSVVGLLSLVFGYFNEIFPDKLNYFRTGNLNQIRMATAVLVVVFPVYIFLAWILGRDYKKNPAKRDIRARRVLLYLTLFVAALTVIVDLVTLIYRFYSGDYTTQFIMKIISVLIVAAAVFGYYLWDIRRTNYDSQKPKLFAWLVGAGMAAIVVSGFFVVGSPAKQRNARFDETRVQNLQEIQSEVVTFWQGKNRLPATLDELKSGITGYIGQVDPETGANYEYNITGPLSFELCAVFKTKGSYDSSVGPIYNAPLRNLFNTKWNHDIGRSCFSRTIDPQLDRIVKPF